MKIIVDTEDLMTEVNKIASYKELFDTLDYVPDCINSRLLRLAESLLLNICILSTRTTTNTGDHVIRLGLSRKTKLGTSIFGALESNFVTHD